MCENSTTFFTFFFVAVNNGYSLLVAYKKAYFQSKFQIESKLTFLQFVPMMRERDFWV